jgi:hypothetical protein
LYRPLLEQLPDDIHEIGLLVRKNLIHRTTLERDGNTGTNADLRFGDMTKMPWWRQDEDDNLPTVAAMLAALYRRDERGLVPDHAVENKLVLTCRNTAILMAAILESKDIPCRVRAGNAPYFRANGKSDDHWINEYWNEDERRWVAIDVDGSLSFIGDFDPYDIPNGVFDFAPKAWLDIRAGKVAPDRFDHAGGFTGKIVVAWQLFYDFHSIMNNECVYMHHPKLVTFHEFDKTTEDQRKEIDELAELMLDIDGNFDRLKHHWDTKREFRLLKGSLL